jgi:chitodextrinase
VFVLDSAGIQVRYDSLVEDEFIVYQGLTFSTEYSSRVKAVNADTISGEFSAPEVFTTSGEISAPLPPSVSFTVTDSSATFTWLSDPNVDFYVLSLDSSNVGLDFFTNYQDTFYVFEGLAPNGTYRGRVRAHNSAGNSGYVSQTFTTADQPGPDPEPILSAPSNIDFFQVGDTSAEVSWDAVGPAIGYVAIVDSAGIQVRYDSLVTGASISYQGLSPNTIYDFRLATVNADGVRGASSGNIPFVTDEPAPIVPDPVASRVQIILIVNGRVVGKPYKVIWTDTPYRMLEIKVFSSNTLFPNPGQIINLSDVPGTLRSKIQILAPNQ